MSWQQTYPKNYLPRMMSGLLHQQDLEKLKTERLHEISDITPA